MSRGDDLSGVGIGETRDAPKERRLAGTAWPKQGHELSGLGGEGKPVEDAALPESLVQTADMNAFRPDHVRRLRTEALTWSMIVTIARMMRRIAKTLGKSSRSMLLFNS